MALDPTMNIPTKISDTTEWISWHKTLKSNFGKKTANALFVKGWSKRGTSSANTKELRDYLEKYKIYLQADGFFEGLEYAAGDIGDAIGDAFTMGKYAIYGVGGLALISLFAILYAIVRDPAGSARTAMLITPQGRMAAAMR